VWVCPLLGSGAQDVYNDTATHYVLPRPAPTGNGWDKQTTLQDLPMFNRPCLHRSPSNTRGVI